VKENACSMCKGTAEAREKAKAQASLPTPRPVQCPQQETGRWGRGQCFEKGGVSQADSMEYVSRSEKLCHECNRRGCRVVTNVVCSADKATHVYSLPAAVPRNPYTSVLHSRCVFLKAVINVTQQVQWRPTAVHVLQGNHSPEVRENATEIQAQCTWPRSRGKFSRQRHGTSQQPEQEHLIQAVLSKRKEGRTAEGMAGTGSANLSQVVRCRR